MGGSSPGGGGVIRLSYSSKSEYSMNKQTTTTLRATLAAAMAKIAHARISQLSCTMDLAFFTSGFEYYSCDDLSEWMAVGVPDYGYLRSHSTAVITGI